MAYNGAKFFSITISPQRSIMKAAIPKTLCFALLLGVSVPMSAFAHDLVDPATPPDEILPKVKLDPTPEGPMGKVGPGDMLTTPKSREKLQKEMTDRGTNPAAMDKQMDKTEKELKGGKH